MLEEVFHLPLSYAQQRLWFIDQLEPGSPAYNLAAAIRLSGRLNFSALSFAINEIVRRHEGLRTSFFTVDGQPLQRITAHVALRLPLIDLSDVSANEPEAVSLARAESGKGFDLTRGPLVRATLLRLDPTDHIALFTLHHIVSDGWSMGILIRELSALYDAFCQGRPSPLAPLALQYADYAVWQRQWLTPERLEQHLQYWRRQLAPPLPVLDLPTDRARPAVRSYRGATCSLELAAAVTDSLKALSRRQGVTLFMTLMAAFKALLYRYTGQEDDVVATPITNRDRAEVEDLIGLFVNTLVIRTDLSGDPTFTELLSRVKRVMLEAQAHQHLPFEMLVDELQPDRNLSHTPLFQVMFVHEPVRREALRLHNLQVRPVDADTETAKFDLSIFMVETDRRLTATIRYNPDLFNADSIQRLLERLELLLEGIVIHPERRLHELSLLTKEERQQLVTWNGTSAAYQTDACLHELFAEQVERTPDAIAVVYEEHLLTYRELNQRANRLARYLRAMGAGVESAVAIHLERSAEMIIAVLGVLKMGGCYLPTDTAMPKHRLALMLEKAGASIVITRQELIGDLPGDAGEVVSVDSDWNRIEQCPGENLALTSMADNPAYIIFTSGSTGKPKGVVIAHKQIVNYLTGIRDRFAIEPGGSFALVQSLAVDASKTLTFYSLCFGGRLHLISQERAGDPNALDEYFSRHVVDCFKLAPSHLSALLEQPHPERIIPRRWLILGGETLRFDLARDVRSLAPECSIINQYGPTEATIGMLAYELSKDDEGLPSLTVPLGHPLHNVKVYVLDRHLQLVPPGVPGELHVGGDCLARGYINNPEMTADKFIPNPFGGELGSRLYRTGDLVRYLNDGNLEFIGRVDDQVKVRGFRVEPGEIEAALLEHPELHAAVVLAREDRDLEIHLVAYVVTARENAITHGELRAFLSNLLPDYMIPSRFVLLDSLPLTPHGKLDRGALPALEQPDGGADQQHVAPRTMVQQVLAGIWEAVLQAPTVGLNDNFFELGGHSLLAAQVTSRVQRAFNVQIPLRCIFESHNLAELAERIEERKGEPKEVLRPIERTSRNIPLPLSYAQQRLWFIDLLDPGSPAYNLAAAIRLSGPLNFSALSFAVNEIVRRHEGLRTSFSAVDGHALQRIAAHVALPVPLIDLSDVSVNESEAVRLAQAESAKGFDLTRGPLVRATLLRLGPTNHIALFTLHHIVSDGWSMGILIRELSVLYDAFCQGLPSPLAPLVLQYADYAVWQRQWLTPERLEQHLQYWRRQLAPPLPVLDLPTDRPRPAIQTTRGARQSFALPLSLLESLKQMSRKENVTLFMTLMAAFKVLLYRYSHQEDITVGADLANRNLVESEDLIGFFVNMGVLRTNLSGDPSFQELLGRVREVALEAYSHQDVPFERLVEEFQPKRDMSRNPLFQVVFVLQNTPPSSLQLSGLTFSSLEVRNDTAKFDLTLLMEESRDGLRGTMEYNTDLFDAGTISRTLIHFQNLLEAIASDSSQSISTLQMLSKAERDQLLIEWSETATDYPRSQCIHELFEAQVDQTPDAIAVAFRDEHLTYRELNRRANQVAHYLKAAGVGPDVRVGICMERSPAMIAAIIGILKAAGAYVPIDPDYPPARVAQMLESAQLSVVLTQERVAEELPSQCARAICLDSDSELFTRQSGHNPASNASPDNLAYLMYTSGSTGIPKGVSVTHQAVVRLVKQTNYADFSATQTFLQLAPITFDASTFEIWGSLLNGARLAVIPADKPSLDELTDTIERHGVTTLWLTAGLFHLMVDEAPGGLKPVSQLLAGGDVLSPQHVRRLLERNEGKRLINGYGPTEGTTFSCCYSMTQFEKVGSSVPIGRPISNTTAYVLDDKLQPVPIAVYGELYIGGDGLARGYHDGADLTAEVFIPNPFGCEPGARLYKTGDRVRYLEDGNIEFNGRRDDQLKIRGFRIEPAEVTSALNRHPAVREAVVVAREDSPNNNRLIAFIVPQHGQTPPPSELRAFLREQLPEYMVPSDFVLMDALPLNSNGKVDRRALPAFDADRAESIGFVAPRTSVEEDLALIWQRVLGINQVGMHDNFFDLGGDSIRILEVCAQAQKVGLTITVSQLFQFQTINELAQEVDVADSTSELLPKTEPFALISDQDRSILPDEIDDAYPVTDLQRGMRFHSEYNPESGVYHDLFSFHIRAPFDAEAFRAAINQLLDSHPMLRTSFDFTSYSQPLQLVYNSVSLPLQIDDLRHLTDDAQEQVLAKWLETEKGRDFDWSRPPLIQFKVFRRGEERLQLGLSFHHAILDGWSFASMLVELFRIYNSKLRNEPITLAPPATTFRDYVALEREAIESEDCRRYWDDQLADSTFTAVPRLSSSRLNAAAPRPFREMIEPDVSEGLRNLARLTGVPLKSVLLAGHIRVLSFLSGQSDVLTGVVSNGRPEAADTERVLGLFLNTVPFRLRLHEGTWIDLARETFNAEREMLPFRRYPLARIQAQLGGHPLFEAIFNFVNFHVLQAVQEDRRIEVVEGDFIAKTNFALVVEFRVDAATSDIHLTLNYDPAELCEQEIERFGQYCKRVLTNMAADPQGSYRKDLLSGEEREQLLVEWNNTKVYVLDSHLDPVPVGAVGELYIGGIGLARGYVNHLDLTAEKFIPDPFCRQGGERLYKTGDLVRYLVGGLLEFVGRADDQIKILGHRIELGEIESILNDHAAIKEAVVVTREDDSGQKRLVAYVAPHDEAEFLVNEMRAFLRKRLPEYMVPAAFVTMKRLPISSNGEVDRPALPAPETSGAALAEKHLAPRTLVEQKLAQIWAEAFRVTNVSTDDDFFDLGGDSLLAMQVVHRVRDAFKVSLRLSELFEAPTLSEFAKTIEAATKAKEDESEIDIRPTSRESELPLSFAQQRLWFIDQLEPGMTAYNMRFGVKLTGSLNTAALEQAIDALVARHEVLRTVFAKSGGRPRQVIRFVEPFEWSLVDMSALDDERQEGEAQRLAEEKTQRSFDLACGPLLRGTLLGCAPTDHIALFTLHHIISDGWSMSIFIRELSALYNAFCQGRPSPLAPLALQYADYAVWQRQWLTPERLEQHLQYWRRQLAPSPPVLDLPRNGSRKAVQGYRGDRHSFTLSQSLSLSLNAFSRRQGVTLFMTLMAAFQSLLHRCTGQEDVVVGAPIMNRDRAEIKDLIGLFVNTVVIRTDLSGDPTFTELLSRVKKGVLEAYAHQDLPFEKLVDALQPERDLSRTPLFQVMFAFQTLPEARLELDGVAASLMASASKTARFDLTLEMVEAGHHISGSLEYNSDLFDEASIERMAAHFENLLEAAVANGDERVSALTLLSAEEREQLLVEWNNTATTSPTTPSLHCLVEAQARLRPHAIAVTDHDAALSYHQLNLSANQLAHHLLSLGVSTDQTVAVLLPRRADMVVALLAVLKAGAAYLPLDPTHPSHRLAFMMADSGAKVLLTERSLALVAAGAGLQVVCLDDCPALAHHSASDPQAGGSADNLAYVIYTSGSTGTPKGVQITHRAVMNFMNSLREQIGITDQDVLLAVTTLAFDIAALEIFLPLIVGARVVVASRELAADARELGKELVNSSITIMQATPSLWRSLLEAKWQGRQRLKMLCGGEQLSRELANRLAGRGDFLWNLYGPTETTIWSSTCRMAYGDGPVLIGKPIANTSMYVLDSHLQPAPAEVAGELYIGGVGMARGYVNQPDITAEKFLPDPFADIAGARLYRTGDLARYRLNGEIEYLGRVDHQVKVRGYRIELGEIESILQERAEIRQAVVLVREDRPGDKRLVAYLVANEGQVVTSELRDYVRTRLPEYMAPSAFVVIPAVPLTPNGKLDRRALPAPGVERPELGSAFIEPQTPVERAIAAAWRTTLQLEQVGVNDNFFDLGGQSLLLVQLQSELESSFNTEVPIIKMFQYPTIRSLARYLADGQAEQTPAQESHDSIERQRQGKSRVAQQFEQSRRAAERVNKALR